VGNPWGEKKTCQQVNKEERNKQKDTFVGENARSKKRCDGEKNSYNVTDMHLL